jgi:hypothetical protein
MVGAGGQEVINADVAGVDQVLVGQQIPFGEVSTSLAVATVVATCTIRWGRSGSQVSVKWALSPRQPTPRLIP